MASSIYLFELFAIDGDEMALVEPMHVSLAGRSDLYNFQTGFEGFLEDQL